MTNLGKWVWLVTAVAFVLALPYISYTQPTNWVSDQAFVNAVNSRLPPALPTGCISCVLQSDSTNGTSMLWGPSLGGGGGGGTVTSVGATPPLSVSGSVSAPVLNFTGILGSTFGGTGITNPTAHTIPIAEGSTVFTLLTCTGFLVGTGGSVDPTCRVLANSDFPTSGVSAGSYTNANVTVNAQGVVTAASNGAGNPLIQHTVVESGGIATMVVNSTTVPVFDDDNIALNANLTLTTPAAAGMATGERVLVHATTSGSAWTVTFAAGAGVTLKDSVLGGSNGAVGQACTVPATGWMNYAFRWDGTNFELLYCGPQPAPTAITTSVGGTGATSLSGWPINIPHTETISGATNETLQTAWVTTEVMTFSASATVTLPQAAFAGQVLNAIVCNNGTGGFVPAFAAAGGLTITGTFPVFTTTASKCGDFSMTYTTTTQAYITGSTAGPL